MTGFLRWPATATPRDDAETADGTDWQIASETRIGAPMPRKRRKWLRRVVVIALLGGTGYALSDEPARGARWWSAVADLASPLRARLLFI